MSSRSVVNPPYGKELSARIRRMSEYAREEIMASGARFLIANRMSYGLSNLDIGTFSRRKDDNKAAAPSHFSPPTVGEMENHYLPNNGAEPAGRYPFSSGIAKTVYTLRIWRGR